MRLFQNYNKIATTLRKFLSLKIEISVKLKVYCSVIIFPAIHALTLKYNDIMCIDNTEKHFPGYTEIKSKHKQRNIYL